MEFGQVAEVMSLGHRVLGRALCSVSGWPVWATRQSCRLGHFKKTMFTTQIATTRHNNGNKPFFLDAMRAWSSTPKPSTSQKGTGDLAQKNRCSP